MSSTQTVYFNNPADITTLQGQVGTTAGQVNTTKVNSTYISTFSTTGAINNLSVNRFVDKYTINNGLGPYMVDAVPICFRETIAMPKFSNNLSTSTGGATNPTGVGGLHYTSTLYDTFLGHDMVVYLPSARTTMETSPVFKETVQGECDNLGAFGCTLADFNGPISALYTTADQWTATLGSSTLGALFNTFYALARDSTSTTGARTAALDAIYANDDYNTVKTRFKYPFKTFDQIKSGSDFQFEQLYSLSGAALINTGADGVTVYPTQITSTTYSATGNLLPVASNVNAISNQMGLFIFHMGDGNNMWIDSVAHQVASWGYAVAFIPGTPMNNRINKFGLTKNIAKMIADRDIPLVSPTGSQAAYFFTGGSANIWARYDSTNDNVVANAGVNGFWRNAFRQMLGTAPAQLIMERYYYEIICVLQKLGVGRYINYNNVVVGGISGGGYGLVSTSKFISTGLSTQYRLNGGSVPLFKTKAYIELQPVFPDYSQKVDAAAASNNFIYNNRYALGINVLPCPFIGITTDADSGNTAQIAAPLADNRFNHQMQTIFQMTKQAGMNTTSAIQNLARSAVFYKSGSSHTDSVQLSALRPGDGQYGASIYNESYFTEWMNGWYLNLNPQWPAIDNTYESGLQNEIAYTMMNDIKANTIVELMAHRFLGNDYPVPQSAMQSLGLRCDIGPTHCDIIPEMEYLRVGPLAQMSYDDNYNIVLKNNPNVATSTQTFNVVATGSNGIFKGVSATTSFTLPVYTAAAGPNTKPSTGNTGQLIIISDSTPPGRLAYCYSNTWYYVSDNSAV